MRKVILCENEDMVPYLFGQITIKNINTRDWFGERGDTLDLRLAIDATKNETDPVYDVMQLVYHWNKNETTNEANGNWSCNDAHVGEQQ
jgi:hypothetical protein